LYVYKIYNYIFILPNGTVESLKMQKNRGLYELFLRLWTHEPSTFDAILTFICYALG